MDEARRKGVTARRMAGPQPATSIAGTITAIEPQVRARSERVNIRIDGQYAFSLAAEQTVGLRVGDRLEARDVAELLERDSGERAYHRALHFLAARPRSAFEIRRRLAAAGAGAESISHVIDRLQRLGLIDDAQFAAYWVEQRQTHRPRGPRALRSELRAKGVSAEAIGPAIQSAADDQGEAACRAGLREARRQGARGEREFALALGKFLSRRGFDYGVVRAATTELWLQVQVEASN
jgi:regulatory protein